MTTAENCIQESWFGVHSYCYLLAMHLVQEGLHIYIYINSLRQRIIFLSIHYCISKCNGTRQTCHVVGHCIGRV